MYGFIDARLYEARLVARVRHPSVVAKRAGRTLGDALDETNGLDERLALFRRDRSGRGRGVRTHAARDPSEPAPRAYRRRLQNGRHELAVREGSVRDRFI